MAPKKAGKTAWTIGYEGRSVEEVLDALAAAKVEVLVDVRERPQSRKPGFSGRALAASLGKRGIAYLHLKELGTPPEVRRAYKADGDFERLKRGYTAHLKGQGKALARAGEVLGQRPAALFCFERDAQACHRSVLCTRLKDGGFRFKHL